MFLEAEEAVLEFGQGPEVIRWPALRAKSGSRGKIQLRWHQGRIASSESQRHTVVSPIAATSPRATAARQISPVLSRESGRPCSRGSSHAKALIAITTPGGKAGRPAVSRLFLQAGQALLEEALAPLADDLAGRVQARRDLVIG